MLPFPRIKNTPHFHTMEYLIATHIMWAYFPPVQTIFSLD